MVSLSSYYYQVIQLVSNGNRLAPPPGCPKAVYSLMIQCWYEVLLPVANTVTGDISLFCSRHPQASSRPTFSQLLQALCQPDTELLSWSEEDVRVHPQAGMLGAPLEAGKDLYPELQQIYKNMNVTRVS